MFLDEEIFCPLLVELMELELSLLRPSLVTISSTIFEMELVPFQFHQNWNQFRNLELLVPIHNTTASGWLYGCNFICFCSTPTPSCPPPITTLLVSRIIPCSWRQRNVVISNQKTPRLIRKKQSRQAILVCLIKRRSWQIVEGLSSVNYSRRFASRPVLYQTLCIFQINHFIKCSPCERKVSVVLKKQAKFYICQRLDQF